MSAVSGQIPGKRERREMTEGGKERKEDGEARAKEENIGAALTGSKLNECVPRDTKDFQDTLLHRSRGFSPRTSGSLFRILVPSFGARFSLEPEGNLNENVNSRCEHVRRLC